MSGMDDDLFTYEVEIDNILCDSNKDDDSKQRVSHEANDDMGYDPSDIRGDDEVELTDEEFSDNEGEVTEVFRIDTNIFDFETPILMKNIRMIGSMNGTETYHGLMRNHGLTLDWRNDGFCNGGNLPGAYIVGNSLYYQDYEWYEALEDDELKEEALRNKAIMEGFANEEDDDESRYERKKRWNIYTNYDDEYEKN
ncbi:reverse transcriptase domain-containing protein [Tanacetum coccineum]|uniref:Reverse transcriptase domain-containing protein n=1 Tax=Tanacetum coccineum TaxID=301880 RepID=A0ABQ5CDK6_9ASTR